VNYRGCALPGLACSFLIFSAAASATEPDPDREHFSLGYDETSVYKTLNFFETPDQKGRPSVILDARGLTLNGQLVCTWKAGSFELEKVGADRGDCGFPLRTSVSVYQRDHYLEIAKQMGDVVQLRWNGRLLYLDLRPLDPPTRVQPSANEERRQIRETRRRDRAQLESDKSYVAFVHDWRVCIGDPAIRSLPIRRACKKGGCPELDEPANVPDCARRLMTKDATSDLQEVRRKGPMTVAGWMSVRSFLKHCLDNTQLVGMDEKGIVYWPDDPGEGAGACIVEKRNGAWVVTRFANGE
jgi:hypothetical protein